ncbi:MAG TPA: hypothetical protein VGH90_02020, partial [Chthoniobacteraceae bacterium]
AGLAPNSTYHFRLEATNSQGTSYGNDATIQMVQPLTISNEQALIFGSEVEFIGFFSGNNSTNAYFEYGPTAAYGSTAAPQLFFPGFAEADVPGSPFSPSPFQPGVTYHYRLDAVNAAGTVFGNDAAFTMDYAAATASYQPVAAITATSATLNAMITESGGTDGVSFEYGLTNLYGASLSAAPASVSGTGAFPVSGALAGLTPGTTYHYRLDVGRSGASSSYFSTSSDQTFTTLTAVANWRQQYFGTTANAGAAADAANPTGDGISNLLKYALGLDPTVPSALLPEAALQNFNGQTYLTYAFSRNPANGDLTYEVLAATSPAGPWTPVASSVAGAPTSGPGFVAETPGVGGQVNVEVRDTVSTSAADKRFLCLRVTVSD